MTEHEKIRTRLEKDMEKFFSAGGEVKHCTSADNKDSVQLKMKPKDGRLYYVSDSKKLSTIQVRPENEGT
jgi:hypothetical protein